MLRLHHFIQKQISLSVKFGIILVVLASLILADYFIARQLIHTEIQDALLINIAGRQRMLSQKMLKVANSTLLMHYSTVPTLTLAELQAEYQTAKTDFQATLETFHQGGLAHTTDKETSQIPPFTRPIFLRSLHQIELEWQQFKQNMIIVMTRHATNKPQAIQQRNNAYQRLTHSQLLPSSDHFVSLLQHEAEQKILLLQTIQIQFLIMGLLSCFGLIYYLFYSIIQPIQLLTATIRYIKKQGDISPRVNVKNKDEIGFLADSFNDMLDRLNQTTVSRDYLNRVLESISESLIVTDRKRVIKMVNKATITLLEYPDEQALIGRQIDEITRSKAVKKSERQLFTPEAFHQLLTQGHVKNCSINYCSANGQEIPVTFSTSTLTDEDNNLIGLVCVASDLREYQTLQAQLIQSSKLAALGTLSAGIAHELRNPLTVVKGNAELIRYLIKHGQVPTPDNLSQEMSDIIAGADRMTAIIDHLKDFSRESKTSDWQSVDLIKIIHDANILLRQKLKNHNITLTVEVPSYLPPVNGDHTKLVSILQNLLSNAIDAHGQQVSLPEKKIRIQVQETEHQQVAIQFSDNGPGISADIINNIFNPFFTTKPVGKGTGLGLSILHGIVEEHGGTVSVTSTLKQGTTFHITLPLEHTPSGEET